LDDPDSKTVCHGRDTPDNGLRPYDGRLKPASPEQCGRRDKSTGVEGIVSDQVLLRDLVVIPDTVHDGDFVLTLSKGVRDKSTITDYVITEPLAANFDKALDLIKSALETGASRAAYG
jgi:hypothetical protein